MNYPRQAFSSYPFPQAMGQRLSPFSDPLVLSMYQRQQDPMLSRSVVSSSYFQPQMNYWGVNEYDDLKYMMEKKERKLKNKIKKLKEIRKIDRQLFAGGVDNIATPALIQEHQTKELIKTKKLAKRQRRAIEEMARAQDLMRIEMLKQQHQYQEMLLNAHPPDTYTHSRQKLPVQQQVPIQQPQILTSNEILKRFELPPVVINYVRSPDYRRPPSHQKSSSLINLASSNYGSGVQQRMNGVRNQGPNVVSKSSAKRRLRAVFIFVFFITSAQKILQKRCDEKFDQAEIFYRDNIDEAQELSINLILKHLEGVFQKIIEEANQLDFDPQKIREDENMRDQLFVRMNGNSSGLSI